MRTNIDIDDKFMAAVMADGEFKTKREAGGVDNALQAATLYRRLREQGRTVRSPIDLLQASCCMTHGRTLLHRDADALQALGGLTTGFP